MYCGMKISGLSISTFELVDEMPACLHHLLSVSISVFCLLEKEILVACNCINVTCTYLTYTTVGVCGRALLWHTHTCIHVPVMR